MVPVHHVTFFFSAPFLAPPFLHPDRSIGSLPVVLPLESKSEFKEWHIYFAGTITTKVHFELRM
jgi:hypothetical protein